MSAIATSKMILGRDWKTKQSWRFPLTSKRPITMDVSSNTECLNYHSNGQEKPVSRFISHSGLLTPKLTILRHRWKRIETNRVVYMLYAIQENLSHDRYLPTIFHLQARGNILDARIEGMIADWAFVPESGKSALVICWLLRRSFAMLVHLLPSHFVHRVLLQHIWKRQRLMNSPWCLTPYDDSSDCHQCGWFS